MATAVTPNRLLASERDSELARTTLESLRGPQGFLALGTTDATGSAVRPLPRELGVLLQEVLQAVAAGSTVTVVTTPSVVTTSTAAAMLGLSRPTLMRLVREGAIPAHKVGTHTRLLTEDVLEFKRARRARERAAFEALLEAEGNE